jgi:hypothetical protein
MRLSMAARLESNGEKVQGLSCRADSLDVSLRYRIEPNEWTLVPLRLTARVFDDGLVRLSLRLGNDRVLHRVEVRTEAYLLGKCADCGMPRHRGIHRLKCEDDVGPVKEAMITVISEELPLEVA